jgi:hypothetical protein
MPPERAESSREVLNSVGAVETIIRRLLPDIRMTSEPRPSEPHRPPDEDPFVVDDGLSDLDQTFAEVEQEMGRDDSKSAPASAAKPTSPAAKSVEVHADADEFAKMSIDDADDVFVIDDEENDASAAPRTAHTGAHPQVTPPPAVTTRQDRLFPAPAAPAVAASSQAAVPAKPAPSRDSARPPAARAGEPPAAATPTASAEDDLFAPAAPGEVSERFGRDDDVFTDAEDQERAAWEGAELSAQEIGINANDGDDRAPSLHEEDDAAWSVTAEQEQDIEIVGDGDATTVGDFAIVDGDPAEQFGIEPIDEDEVSAPASGVWDGADSSVSRADPVPTAAEHEPDVSELHDGDAGDDDATQPACAEEDGEGATADEDYDPIYGSAAAAEEAGAGTEFTEPVAADYSEHEAAYVDQTRRGLVLVGAPAGSRRRGPLTLVAAAALIVCGVTAGFAFMQPEWLGLSGSNVLVDRALIARPDLALEVAQPAAPADNATPDVQPGDLLVHTDPQPNPTPDPVTRTDPDPVRDPKTDPPPVAHTDPVVPPQNPVTQPDPVTQLDPQPKPLPDPVAQVPEKPPVPTNPTPDVTPVPPVAQATEPAAHTDVVRIGEDLQVGRMEPAPARPRVHHLAEGLVTGSQAFAQLRNMNFFLGRVKAMDSSFLTLDLTPGEITIAFDELNAIVPLASEEYRAMQGSADGFVKLTNRNKLFGKILTNSLADNVVLEVQQNHVVIPRASIEEVGSQTKTSVQVMQDEDADWIKAMLERQAPKAAPKTTVPSTPPGPAAGSAPPPR